MRIVPYVWAGQICLGLVIVKLHPPKLTEANSLKTSLPFLIHPSLWFLKSAGRGQYDWFCFAANKIWPANNLLRTYIMKHTASKSLIFKKKILHSSRCVWNVHRPVLWSNEAISRLLAAFATFDRFSWKTKAERWPSPEAVLSSLYFA